LTDYISFGYGERGPSISASPIKGYLPTDLLRKHLWTTQHPWYLFYSLYVALVDLELQTCLYIAKISVDVQVELER
jgi:hypothetical protein